MIPRRLLVLAGSAALLGSLFAAPSFATTPPGTPPPVHTKLTCDPSTKTKGTAPVIGAQATYQAGAAGSVVIKRTDAVTLTVVSSKANAGWTATTTLASGHRVKVSFADSTTRELQHLGVGLSARGTFVMVSTSHCHH
jgi:hypothetical protein